MVAEVKLLIYFQFYTEVLFAGKFGSQVSSVAIVLAGIRFIIPNTEIGELAGESGMQLSGKSLLTFAIRVEKNADIHRTFVTRPNRSKRVYRQMEYGLGADGDIALNGLTKG